MSDAWVQEAIDVFNYPEENGEAIDDEPATLRRMLAEVPAEAARRVSDVKVLLDEIERLAHAAHAEFERAPAPPPPYTKARLRDGALELFHFARQEWIPASEREAHRAAPTSAPRPDAARLRALWEGIDSAAPGVEQRFQAATGKHLTIVAADLRDAGEHALVETIAARVLSDGAQFPGHWWVILAESRLRRGDPAGARRAIAHALLFTTTYGPSALALMYQWLEANGADVETLAIVYHGATKWTLNLKSRQYLGWKSLPKPDRLKTRFGSIYAAWVREVWPGAQAFTRDQLRHLRTLFKELAGRPLDDLSREVEARLDR